MKDRMANLEARESARAAVDPFGLCASHAEVRKRLSFAPFYT
jgi:hypothetical protein